MNKGRVGKNGVECTILEPDHRKIDIRSHSGTVGALGTDAVGAAPGYVNAKVKEYLTKHYHQPSDEYETVVLDLKGARQFAEFVRDVTIAVANDQTRPSWLPGAEFERPKARASSGHCER